MRTRAAGAPAPRRASRSTASFAASSTGGAVTRTTRRPSRTPASPSARNAASRGCRDAPARHRGRGRHACGDRRRPTAENCRADAHHRRALLRSRPRNPGSCPSRARPAAAPGTPPATSASRRSRSRRNHGRDPAGSSGHRRARSSTREDPRPSRVEGGVDEVAHRGRVGAMLGRFVRQIDLNQDLRPRVDLDGRRDRSSRGDPGCRRTESRRTRPRPSSPCWTGDGR